LADSVSAYESEVDAINGLADLVDEVVFDCNWNESVEPDIEEHPCGNVSVGYVEFFYGHGVEYAEVVECECELSVDEHNQLG